MILFYLKVLTSYAWIKLGGKLSFFPLWRLDFYAYCRKRNIEILLEDKKGFVVKTNDLGGLKFRIRHLPSSDYWVFRGVINEHQYKIQEEAFEKNKALRIIDAGANVGYTSIYLNHFHPNSTIIAIEPLPENIAIIQENLALNQLTNIHVENQALWYKKTQLSILSDFRDRREHSTRTVETEEKGDKLTPSITLKEVMEKYQLEAVDFLKIDIEGAEKMIFENDVNLNAVLERTKVVAIEIHDEFDCRNQILGVLKQHFDKITDEGELTIGVKNY